MTDITDSALLFINPLSDLVQIRIDTDILRNGIRLVRLKSADVLLYIV